MLYGREHFYAQFRDRVNRIAAADPVLDLGTDFRFRKELKPWKDAFRGRYVAMGYKASPHGERSVHVDGDIHCLPFRTGSAGGVLCLEVLEHLPAPHRAVEEMHRVLRPGGALLLTTPFMAGYHGKPGEYADFFRYTDEGLRMLLSAFSRVEVVPLGGYLYRLLFTAAPARVQSGVLRSGAAMRVFNALDRRLPTRSPLRWLVWAEK
jgi:SAM-dependent methyltransferase